jgi:hypothetical protein
VKDKADADHKKDAEAQAIAEVQQTKQDGS